jgi:hypothetical protein
MSACILHNLCVISEDNVDDYIQENNDNIGDVPVMAIPDINHANGIGRRQAIVNHLANLYGYEM